MPWRLLTNGGRHGLEGERDERGSSERTWKTTELHLSKYKSGANHASVVSTESWMTVAVVVWRSSSRYRASNGGLD